MLSSVLIIDKRKELSIKYKKSIDCSEITSLIANNLRDALVMLQAVEPDMVIVSDSIEEKLADFCQKIRTLTYNTRPVIVALSKSAETEDRIKVLECGADDFISEPVNIEEFKSRIRAHLRRDVESNLDNKTLLPNQKYVRKALKRVLASESQAVLFASIENLESFKSIYTEVAADKILQTFIAIAKSALEESDFIGQFNENSFAIVTNRYNAEKLANFLTFAFDTVAPKFYSDTDSKRGYTLLKGERFAGMRVNFVSVLIGGIVDGFNLIHSVDTLISRLADVKEMARIPMGSNYAIERAKLTATDSVVGEIFNKNVFIKEKDDSLKYLIQTTLELQGYDVQDEIDSEQSIQPKVLIIDSGEGLEELAYVKQIKGLQNFVNTKVIVTTSVHNKSVVLDSGADLYLPKPYEISDLIRWVEYFLK